jgi:hypothetical protein
MPLSFEIRPPLGEIEELSIADDRDAAILVEEWLSAVLYAHDAKPAMREANPRGKQETRIIGATMDQSGRHAPHQGPIRLPSTRKVD